MNQRGAHQPRHERGVLNRVPEPPASPPKLVIRPHAAKRDPERQKNPRDHRPRARPARPRRIEASREQGGDGESKRHREPDVTRIEHGRMQHHGRILQQRVEIAPIEGHRKQAVERIRGKQHEREEADVHQSHHAEHARDHIVRKTTAEHAHRDHPHSEYQRPQQQRAFMPAPDSGDAVLQRQRGIGSGRDKGDREILVDERGGETCESDCDENELSPRGGARDAHPRRFSSGGAGKREHALCQRNDQRQRQRELTEFGDHQRFASACGSVTSVCVVFWTTACAFLTASAASGGI